MKSATSLDVWYLLLMKVSHSTKANPFGKVFYFLFFIFFCVKLCVVCFVQNLVNIDNYVVK